MVAPPIPLLLPTPEEKKPPAKRIEGIIPHLPRRRNKNFTLLTRKMLLNTTHWPSSGQEVELPFKM